MAQVMYDLAQKLSHMEYGWLIILVFMSGSLSSSVLSRFAPLPVPDDLTLVVRFQS